MTKDSFTGVIQRALTEKCIEIAEEEAARAAIRVTKRVRDLAPEIACALMNRYNMEMFPDHLRITIAFKDLPGPVPHT